MLYFIGALYMWSIWNFNIFCFTDWCSVIHFCFSKYYFNVVYLLRYINKFFCRVFTLPFRLPQMVSQCSLFKECCTTRYLGAGAGLTAPPSTMHSMQSKGVMELRTVTSTQRTTLKLQTAEPLHSERGKMIMKIHMCGLSPDVPLVCCDATQEFVCLFARQNDVSEKKGLSKLLNCLIKVVC